MAADGRLPHRRRDDQGGLALRGAALTRATAAGVGLAFAVGWNIANVGATAQGLADDYGVGLATIGLLTTALFIVHAAMQIPGGIIADRFGAQRAGVLAAAWLVAANVLALAAPAIGLAFAARALAGLGTGVGFVAGSDYVRAAGGSATAQGFYGGAAVGGGGIALAVVPPLEDAIGFRAPFASAAALAVLAGMALAVAPRVREAPAAHAGDLELRSVLLDPLLARFAVIHTASFGLSVVIGNWVVTLLERDGVSSGLAGSLGALVLLSGFVTRPFAGWLVRRRPARARLLVSASLAIGAGATAVLAAPDLPLAVQGVACGVLGLAAGVPFAPAFAGAQAARPDAPGAAIGLVNAWAALAIVVGTPLVGLTFSLPSDGRIGFACVAALWASSLAAVPAARRLAASPQPRD